MRKRPKTADCQPTRDGGDQKREQRSISQPQPHQNQNQQRIDEVNQRHRVLRESGEGEPSKRAG